jgi:hypothetical protein
MACLSAVSLSRGRSPVKAVSVAQESDKASRALAAAAKEDARALHKSWVEPLSARSRTLSSRRASDAITLLQPHDLSRRPPRSAMVICPRA